jgi:hypothetical protein
MSKRGQKNSIIFIIIEIILISIQYYFVLLFKEKKWWFVFVISLPPTFSNLDWKILTRFGDSLTFLFPDRYNSRELYRKTLNGDK